MGWDVAGIGNALMDALVVLEDDALLVELGLTRGTMHPVDHDRWEEAYARVRTLDVVFDSGGSCANTIATAGRLGAHVTYCGQVGDDQMGHLYASLIEKSCGRHALRFDAQKATGKCLSLITGADHERTMLTDLGAAIGMQELGSFADDLRSARFVHFTGYTLLDGPMHPVVLEAMRIAKEAGAKISMDAADPFVVHTVRDRFRSVLRDHCDIAFVNAEESRLTTGIEDPAESARALCAEAGLEYVAVKLGSRGSVVYHDGELAEVPVFPVDAKDTTGAGDAYAGGFLHGLTQGWEPARAGRLGSAVAGLTVSQIGAVVHDQERLQQVLRSIRDDQL